jgi:hypothetical protein
VSVVARRPCRDAATALHLRRALAADTPPFVELAVEGRELVIRTRGPSARSVRATLEDLIACVQVAERSVASGPETK